MRTLVLGSLSEHETYSPNPPLTMPRVTASRPSQMCTCDQAVRGMYAPVPLAPLLLYSLSGEMVEEEEVELCCRLC